MIPRLPIDTNAYSALFAGNRFVADIIAESETIMLSPVVIGELLDGFFGGPRDTENRRDLDRFRSKPRTATLTITDATAALNHDGSRTGILYWER